VHSGLLRELQELIGDAYEIERELGGGGMSHVYLATERSLGRKVVIKVLPPDMLSGVSEARFRREILVTANLQHPNILPVLASGAKGDIHYFVTPFVEGQTLRERLTFDGPLPVADGLQILNELTSALAHAHARGIVHRDIKPENILLSAGHAVLADFGIAAACHRCNPSQNLTLPGQSPGTPGYMAPEQLMDPTGADSRVDVFALGVVAFELFSGKKPFSGSTPNAFFLGTPPQLAVPGVPATVAAAITRAMSPDPDKRFATAAEFHSAVRVTTGEVPSNYGRKHWHAKLGGAILGAALLGGYLMLSGRLTPRSEPNEVAVADRKMLAVLPFKNLGRPEDMYFADGVTEEITSRLAMLSGLGVISRTSADQYANSTKSLREIARELGADYVLEGSVRVDKPTAGPGRVRVTPQLIRVRDDTHLWSFPYEGELKDVFTVQSQIAEKVAGALAVALPGAQREQMEAKPTENLAAYDAYMQGERLRSRESTNLTSLVRAEKLLLEATQTDPRFALAFAKLALLHMRMYESFMDRSPKRLAAARAAADSAIALDSNLPDAHLALGAYFGGTDDITAAALHFGAAEKLRPNDATMIVLTAAAVARGGSWQEALPRFARAAELDPRATRVQLGAAEAFGMAHDYTKALLYVERAIAADSDNVDAFVMKTRLTMAAGDWAGARQLGRRIIQRFGAERAAGTEFFDHTLAALDTTDLVTLERVPLAAFAGNKIIYHFWRTQLFERWQPERARAHADTLWSVGQSLIVQQQNNRIVRGGAAWTNAFLGNRERALEDASKALELATQTNDPYAFAETGHYITYTYLRLGEQEKAVELFDRLLRSPSWLSAAWLKNDPLLAPLRSHPRFQQLLARNT
jgi:serine/threonine-protein kinase